MLATGLIAGLPRWSPDGKRILFFASRANSSEGHALWVVSAGGGDAAMVRPEIGPAGDPTWSPDGRRVLFHRYGPNWRPEPGDSGIRILRLDTGEVERIPGAFRLTSPRWSPDGKQLLALSHDRADLWLFDPVRRDWRQLSEKPVNYPSWSADGRFIRAAWWKEGLIAQIDPPDGTPRGVGASRFQGDGFDR